MQYNSPMNCENYIMLQSRDYNSEYCLASNYSSRGVFLSFMPQNFQPPPPPLSSLSFVPLSVQHFKGPNILCLRAFCSPTLAQNIRFNTASHFGHLLYDIYDILCPASKYRDYCPILGTFKLQVLTLASFTLFLAP